MTKNAYVSNGKHVAPIRCWHLSNSTKVVPRQQIPKVMRTDLHHLQLTQGLKLQFVKILAINFVAFVGDGKRPELQFTARLGRRRVLYWRFGSEPENDCRSFSQLLVGAMSSPTAVPNVRRDFPSSQEVPEYKEFVGEGGGKLQLRSLC
ncbi:Uncharacterized protein Adt_30756 [Abeliophyllum distichum]|uniref:Uncharacterized protein n=1 Tax=Abeliophyllum distichum TaxID=126358 RepID=A0ABD1RC53_9LAMI